MIERLNITSLTVVTTISSKLCLDYFSQASTDKAPEEAWGRPNFSPRSCMRAQGVEREALKIPATLMTPMGPPPLLQPALEEAFSQLQRQLPCACDFYKKP